MIEKQIIAKEGYVFRRLRDGFILGNIINLGIDYYEENGINKSRVDKEDYYEEILEETENLESENYIV